MIVILLFILAFVLLVFEGSHQAFMRYYERQVMELELERKKREREILEKDKLKREYGDGIFELPDGYSWE